VNTATHESDVKKLAKLIHGIDFCMMTTVGDDGSLHSRPMATQRDEFDGTLWFFTEADAGKVFEVEHDRQVNLSYADPRTHRYVSISGRARLVRDKEKAKELWNPMYKAWFPQGLDDPKLALLAVDVSSAEYWATPGTKITHLVGFTKAMLTGDRYEPGDHAKVRLS
jgi:general stress protein 26